MKPPEYFDAKLSRLFDNRLRIRWSFKREEWHLEYKVGRGKIPNLFVGEYNDTMIRARDGYGLFMIIRPGDRMPCPWCGFTVKVPIQEMKEATCDYCKLNGKDGRIPAAFYPLEGDTLIQHLIKMDPMRTYRDGIAKRVDEQNDRVLKSAERKFENDIQAITKENYKDLVGIQSVGYTGKEFK